MSEDVVLSVEELTKQPTDVHEVRYRPTMSIFWRLRDRQAGFTVMASDAGGVDIDADDDADDGDDQGDGIYVAADQQGPTLSNVSFEVRRGEAVAIVGRDETPRELAKVLSGTVAPSSGRVVVDGRICPGGELLNNLLKREPHPRRAAAAVASLVGIPWRRRRAYVRTLLDRVVDDDAASLKPQGKANPLVRRVALAAQFDPWADVLVVDSWPGPPAFGEQFVASVQDALERGAGVLIVNPPPFAEGLCRRAIWLEDGAIVRDGPADAVLPELRHAIEEDRRRTAHLVHGFDQFIAIHAVEPQRAGRRVHTVEADDDLDVVVQFEASETLESVVCTVAFRGARGTVDFEQDEPWPLIAPGRHAVVGTLPAGALPGGDYAIDASFTAEHGSGAKSRVAWPQAARIRVAAPDELEVVPASATWDYRDAVEV